MHSATNNLGAEIALTEAQKKILDSINAGESVLLKASGEDGNFLVDNGLCIWNLFTGTLTPIG